MNYGRNMTRKMAKSRFSKQKWAKVHLNINDPAFYQWTATSPVTICMALIMTQKRTMSVLRQEARAGTAFISLYEVIYI
jgi:hypothetical protein